MRDPDAERRRAEKVREMQKKKRDQDHERELADARLPDAPSWGASADAGKPNDDIMPTFQQELERVLQKLAKLTQTPIDKKKKPRQTEGNLEDTITLNTAQVAPVVVPRSVFCRFLIAGRLVSDLGQDQVPEDIKEYVLFDFRDIIRQFDALEKEIIHARIAAMTDLQVSKSKDKYQVIISNAHTDVHSSKF